MNDKPVHEQIAEDRAHYLANPDEDEWQDSPPPANKGAKREVGTMISVRLSASEADEIKAAANTADLPVSAFMRLCALERTGELAGNRGRQGGPARARVVLGRKMHVDVLQRRGRPEVTATTVHLLKTWTPYFSAVVDGSKPFEVRRDDRGFQRGDRVRLVETTQPRDGTLPTGREAEYEITYVLTGGQFGIAPGYVVLGLGSAQTAASSHPDTVTP